MCAHFHAKSDNFYQGQLVLGVSKLSSADVVDMFEASINDKLFAERDHIEEKLGAFTNGISLDESERGVTNIEK